MDSGAIWEVKPRGLDVGVREAEESRRSHPEATTAWVERAGRDCGWGDQGFSLDCVQFEMSGR